MSTLYRTTRHVTFPADSADVPTSEGATIQGTAHWINKIQHGLEVEGHADPSEHVPGLSLRRAKAVLELLVQYGVERRRLIAVDKGTSSPPEGVERNSQVTFNVRHDKFFGCE